MFEYVVAENRIDRVFRKRNLRRFTGVKGQSIRGMSFLSNTNRIHIDIDTNDTLRACLEVPGTQRAVIAAEVQDSTTSDWYVVLPGGPHNLVDTLLAVFRIRLGIGQRLGHLFRLPRVAGVELFREEVENRL